MTNWPFWVGVVMGVWLALSVAVAFAVAEFFRRSNAEGPTHEYVIGRDVESVLGEW